MSEERGFVVRSERCLGEFRRSDVFIKHLALLSLT